MDRFDLEEVVAPSTSVAESPLKEWRSKYQAGLIHNNDFIEFFQKESRKYFDFQYEYGTDSDEHSYRERKLRSRKKEGQRGSLKCMFKEESAREAMIDVLLEFVLGDNPNAMLEKLQNEGNTTSVCGKVFKSGEPTYSCRECVMDPTCVLCVNCFKQSAHRFHKYKMSTSCGGGCCDCGDEEAWKKDHYCEEHLRAKENPTESSIITDAIKERCEIAFVAILSFCVKYLEIETNASLECLDGDSESDDNYCTVLYNDESHTFDQVISTLQKVAKNNSKDAMEIVSAIDREGRAVVKCDSFCECNQLKEAIEKYSLTAAVITHAVKLTQSLRVSVLHMRAVACQQFALQLLSWCQEFLVRHRVFRQIFAKVIFDKTARYNIRHILEYDVKLWKTARSCWHRLLISGLLMEYDNKMALAQEFSRNYATIMQDFINDDHDHSFSIVSLSVQLFTVPSIAHYLIAHEGILFKLLHTFYHESIENFIQNKTLHFAKNMTGMTIFKRAAYILYDLRYILAFKPDTWTDELREGFLEGCKALLRLLNSMQGMEAVTRQTGQHMDYEPEWECAFNLHIKLATTISLILEWCASDREVLTKLYTMVMRNMVNNGFIVSLCKTETKLVAGYCAQCIVYDVPTRPVSMHLPLSRLFAGIYLHLGQYGLNFDNATTVMKRSPEELMEPILCTLAMIAQVHSGMWRRNGYSLLHQLFFYRNVRCRSEMLDRDIVGMQIGASLIESNEYLIILLNKFSLIDWIQAEYEKSLGVLATDDDFIKKLSMIDEFLELLIVIIGERYMPGVAHITEEDRTRKEIIQLLSIKSFSHSELNRALPDANNETALEGVIDSVAVFKKPQKSDSKGVYELKPELYDEYNMYFYHYTKEDKSKSEERQRLRRKAEGQLVCCPPPQLPQLTEPFITLANLLQCRVMMTIISAVLTRAMDLKAKSFQENHLQKVLHLIGYGLQEELSGHYPFLTFYASTQEYNILALLEELSRSNRVEAHRDFILWTIRKFKEVQTKQQPESTNDSDKIQNEEGAVAAAAAAAAADEKSEEMLVTTAEQEKREKEERARLAADRREKIMAQMQFAQRNFMQSNAEMFASANAVATKSDVAGVMDWQTEETMLGDEEGAVAYKTVACLGVEQRLQQVEEQQLKCILCFEDCSVTKDRPTLVYSAYVQKSKVLPPESKYDFSVYTSSCGHVMHACCWQEYYTNEETKEQRRPYRSRNNVSQLVQNVDFQCPYCRYLSNTVLPLTPPLSKYAAPHVIHSGDEVFPIDQWIELLNEFTNELNVLRREEDSDMWHLGMPSWEELLKHVNPLNTDTTSFERLANFIDKPDLPASWGYYVQNYIKSVRRYTPRDFEINENEGLLWMWHSCIYTVEAMEVYLRAIEKPFKNEMSIRHESCLSGLIRACCLQAANLQQTDVRNLLEPVVDLLETVLRQSGQSVLGWNCFSLLVSTILMVPNMLFSSSNKRVVASGSFLDYYTLQLFFLANMVKATVLFEAPVRSTDFMDMDEEEEMQYLPDDIKNIPLKLQENLVKFYKKYNIPARKNAQQKAKAAAKANEESASLPSPSTLDIECNLLTISALFEYIKTEMREFLRRSCLFFHFATDVEFPEEFEYLGGDTYENMCKYLGLKPNIANYFDYESSYATILDMFASHNDIVNYDMEKWPLATEDLNKTIVPCTRPVPQLVILPEDYSDLINSVSEFICPKNPREEMKSPTMCLICGKILCGQSFCCQPELKGRTVGACTYHANFCAAHIGIFLRIRDCQVVYLGSKKGCWVQPPYLDEYGETDQGLRRGNPLRLCTERYNKIHLHWLGHELHEEVARLSENTSMPLTQWHHM